MTVMSLKEATVRTVTLEWQHNGQTQFITITEWGNKEGFDLSGHNIAPIQLTNQQLMSIINCATRLLLNPNNNN